MRIFLELFSTSRVSASSKWRLRPICLTRTVSPIKAPLTNTAFPSRRPTPRPSWAKPWISSSNSRLIFVLLRPTVFFNKTKGREFSQIHALLCDLFSSINLALGPVSSAIHGLRGINTTCIYFCFQSPVGPWYHQPALASRVHCLAKVSRICFSHSGCPLATAISR